MNRARPAGRKAASHERIVSAAARAIRRGGFAGVAVADIMKEAGLTHGGFYAHFPSRDALLLEALERASQESAGNAQRIAKDLRIEVASPFRQLVESYLSEDHLKGAESGCPVAALVSEMPRQSAPVRKAAARSVRSMVSAVQGALAPGVAADSAAVIASELVGALQLARALGANAEGKSLLAAVRGHLLARYDTPPRR